MKTPVSVVILAKNEAARIEECLRSVEWADETLIIDDESADRTVEIAERLGARVLKRRMDIEGRHRNWAYAQAKHDWVLSLDADERVTPELAQEIDELLGNNPSCDIYSFPRKNYIGTQWILHGGWYPSPQVKLFKKEAFEWEETTVHPRAISKSNKPWGDLKKDLIHYSYRDLADFVAKLNRQTTLEAQKWVLDGRKMPMGKALWRAVDRFFRTFWLKKGRQDGFLGFFVAVCGGMYQFLSYAKYWHLKTAPFALSPSTRPLPITLSKPFILRPFGKLRAGPLRMNGASKGLSLSKETGRLRTSLPKGEPFVLRPAQHERHPRVIRAPHTLSVVILTRNAAGTIQRCLDSVRWANEIIVVDGGSTDETVSLCEKAGARVIPRAPTDNFGEERNAGTDAAKGDWVLQLDADEVVTPEFREALEQILQSDETHAAYKFRRTNFFLGTRMRFGGWEHDSLHLFKRGRARYEGRVHERLLVDGRTGTLQVGVNHYPFQSLEQFMDRQNRYTTLEAKQLVESQGKIPIQTIRRETMVKPIKLFWKIGVKKQGFRNGTIGLIFGGLYAFVHFLKWAKVWEILYANQET